VSSEQLTVSKGKKHRLISLFASHFSLFIVLCSLFSVSCVPQAEGPSVPVEPPLRIVSLVPAVTEILFAIGAGDRVVGVTQHCNYPPEVLTITSVGGFTGATMSLEQVQVLRPDLVFISEDMHGRILSLLDELNIPSFAVEPRNFSEVFDTIALIGEVIGFQEGAEDLITGMKERIALVEEQIRDRERPSVSWLLAERPLMTIGSETFVSEAIGLGGGRNLFDDVREHWPLVSPEQVLLRRPDWVFIGDDMGEISQLQNNPFWQTIPAVRDGRVITISADIFYRYGPRLVDGVVFVAEILHSSE
jgi:iron complex transport system substrate-binding protein